VRILAAARDLRERVVLERIDSTESPKPVRERGHLLARPIILSFDSLVLIRDRGPVGIAVLIAQRQDDCPLNPGQIEQRDEICGA
jgi:hypothetical protein